MSMAFAESIYLWIIFFVLTSTQSVAKPSLESTPKISAVLLECPRGRGESSKLGCERQLLVHIRMSPTFQIDPMDKFLLLNEVYDQRTHTKAKLMAPYLIEVSRGEPVIMYPLEFAKSIRCDTFGYGNDNSTTSNSGELRQTRPATVSDNAKLNDPTQSTRQEHHATRGIKAEVKLDEQQNVRADAQNLLQAMEHDLDEDKFIDSEDSGKKSNADLGKPPGEGESNERRGMDAGAVDDVNLVRLESHEEGYMPPGGEAGQNEALFHYEGEYEGDDYDETNANEDSFLGLGEEKELRTGLVAPILTDESLAGNGKKIVKAVDQEEARRATTYDDSATGGVSELEQRKKFYQDFNHEVDRYFQAFSRGFSEKDRGPIRRRFPKVYEGDGEEALQKNRKFHLANTIQYSHPKTIKMTSSFRMDHVQGRRGTLPRTASNLNTESASLLPAAASPFHLHTEPVGSSDKHQGRQDSYGAAIEAAGEEEINAVDYEDNMRRLTPGIQSGSNIAKVDSPTMGEEFHSNTVNYPRGKRIPTAADSSLATTRDVLDDLKLGGYESVLENRRELQKMGRARQPNRGKRMKVKTKSEENSGRGSPGNSDGLRLPVDNRNPTENQMPSSPSRFHVDSRYNSNVPSIGSSKSMHRATDKLTAQGNAPGEACETLNPVPYVPLYDHPGLNRQTNDLQSSPSEPSRQVLKEVPLSTGKVVEEKGLNKRSYLVYDDLTMRDTYEKYDDAEDTRPIDAPARDAIAPSNKRCNEKLCCENSEEGKSCRCSHDDGQYLCSETQPIKEIRSVSEAWYSVYNMSAPLQFLTTRVGILQKRHGAWSNIAPSVTLTSLSGIYANRNLSILFSSHVDIFQLKRPLTPSHHKLVIPHYGRGENAFSALSTNPGEILAVDSTKFDFTASHDGREETVSRRRLCQTAFEAKQGHRHHRSHSISEGVFWVDDLASFPTLMNPMQKCPTGGERLCLNLLYEEVPAFTIRIKQPFLRNALVFRDLYEVRILSVVSDATTRGALQVAVVLVNQYFVVHEFAVCICDCPMTCGARTTVKKNLPPHSAERLTFLLPQEETKPKKMECSARCLCMWDCSCHCVPDLVSHDEYNVCRKLSKNDEDSAGFDESKGAESRGWGLFLRQMIQYTLVLVSIALLLGFLKASLGASGLHRINRMGYNYVQPLHKYEYASRWRRFFINALFFVVLPFIFCCKCFVPSEEDLLVASTVWQCSLLQRDMSDDSSDDGGAAGGYDGTRNGGGRLYKRYRYNDDNGAGGGGPRNGKDRRRVRYGSNINDDDDDEEETILSQRFESGDGSQAAEPGIGRAQWCEDLGDACGYDEDEEERDTNFVLQALTESRESIRRLLDTQCNESIDPKDPLAQQAEEYVRKLVAAKIVYRIFGKPLHNVNVPEGQRYSVRGYFVPSIGSGYQYFTPRPLAQLRRITANTSAILLPPVMLHAESFSREYSSKMEVLQACDLSVHPPEDAPCINSSSGADPGQLTAPRTLDVSSSQVIKPIEQPVGDATNATMRKPLPSFGNATAARDNLIGDASNESNSMAR